MAPGGVTTDSVVEFTTENGATAPSKVTEPVASRLVPVIVTPVPPDVGPEDGATVATVGTST